MKPGVCFLRGTSVGLFSLMQQATGPTEGGDPVTDAVMQQLFQYGLPTVLLLAGCLGAWKILWGIGAFLAPLVRELFSAVKTFLETNVKFLQKMEILGDGLLRQQEAQTALMERTDGKISDIHRAVVKP